MQQATSSALFMRLKMLLGKNKIEVSPLHHIIDPARTFFGQHGVCIKDRERLVRSLLHLIVQKGIDTMVTHEFPMSKAGVALDVQVRE